MALDVTSVPDVALHLSRLGYHVVPVRQGTKAAVGKDWQKLRLTPDQIPEYFDPDTDPAIGIQLGTEVLPRCHVTNVDIDVEDELLIERVGLAFCVPVVPAKRGSKGLAYFCKTSLPLKKRYIRRHDPISKAQFNVIEILGLGQMTVIPPSTHPKTNMPYEWRGKSLLDCDPYDLPELTSWVVEEIELAVRKPDSNLFLLNDMMSGGGKGGGTIHNSVLSAVATMVGIGWPDEVIWARVRWATQRALQRSGDPDNPDNPDYASTSWELTVRRMVEDARAKGFDKQSKKLKPHMVAAQWLLSKWKGEGTIAFRQGMLFVYENGWWKATPHDDIRRVIAREYPEPNDTSFVHSDWKVVAMTAEDMASELKVPAKKKVCLINGTFDLEECVLMPHSPDDGLIAQLPFEYDENAQCPVYDEFMKRTFWVEPSSDHAELQKKGLANGHNPDIDAAINCYEEYLIMTTVECLIFQVFMVLHGATGSGKSVLLNIAKMFHGSFSAVGVHDFGNEQQRAAMVGKLINISAEVAATSHAVDDFLKAVTSGDSIQVRFLYKEAFSTVIQARILMACNDLFRVRDTSGAVERRMLLLSCNNPLSEEDQDPKLLDKIRLEMPGIFNRLVFAYKTLMARGRFKAPRYTKRRLEDFTKENNHVRAWVEERTWQGSRFVDPQLDINPKWAMTEVSELYQDFAEWAKLNNFRILSSTTFGSKIGQIRIPGFNMDPVVKWVGGKSVRFRPLTLVNPTKY